MKVKLSERAEKGKANEQLISFFSELFKVSSGNVQIISGLKSSRKSVKITGLNISDILKKLAHK